jgi:uncharacterized protein YodC (DUF2158 family)
MAEQFKAGDTVRLKSGGPLMTVNRVEPEGRTMCEWFDDKGTPQFRTFPSTSLAEDDGVGIA